MLFRNDMILQLLRLVCVQEYDSKRVAICTREVVRRAVRSEADAGAVTRSRIAAASRRTEHSEEWPCHLRGARSPCAERAGGQISSMFYFNPGVKSNKCRVIGHKCVGISPLPDAAWKAALHRPTRRARSDARFNPRVKPNRCRLLPRAGTRDTKAALHRPARRARSDARFNSRVKRRFGEIPRSRCSLGTTSLFVLGQRMLRGFSVRSFRERMP
jgi:hypothetical protein